MTEIRDYVLAQPIFETHNHQGGFSAHDWNAKCFEEFVAYGTADFAVAGFPWGDVQGDKEKFFQAWPYVRTTGYGQAVELGCKELLGLDYTLENADAITAGVRNLAQGKTNRQVTEELFEKANVGWTINDCNWGVPDTIKALASDDYPDSFRFVIRFEHGHKKGRSSAGANLDNIQYLEKSLDVSIHSLSDLDNALDIFAQQAMDTGKLAGYKIGLAYCRELDFDDVPKAAAEKVLADVLNERIRTPKTTKIPNRWLTTLSIAFFRGQRHLMYLSRSIPVIWQGAIRTFARVTLGHSYRFFRNTKTSNLMSFTHPGLTRISSLLWASSSQMSTLTCAGHGR